MKLFKKKSKWDSDNADQMNILEERRLILSDESDFFRREAYKALRTNVLFSLTGEERCKVIVTTSSMKSEGKSTTAINLALSLAELDRRVLIIDCDMRRPKLGRVLGLGGKTGLSNVLMDYNLMDDSVIKHYRTIDVILAGDIPPNPAEMLGSPRMERLLNELKEKYDYIILDTPPVNMVTDAVVLAPKSNGVIFVVRANQSERDLVAQAVNQLEYANAKVLGFVLNGVDLAKSGHGYGKYRYQQYAYGYEQRSKEKAAK